MCSILIGSCIISEAAGYAISHLITPKSAISREWRADRKRFHSKYDSCTKQSQQSSPIFLLAYYWKFVGRYFTGWYSTESRTLILFLFVCWIVIGALYVMVVYEWPFVTAIYFSLTTCSSASLLPPKCINTSSLCDVGTWNGIFIGTYCLLGVPSKTTCIYIHYILH